MTVQIWLRGLVPALLLLIPASRPAAAQDPIDVLRTWIAAVEQHRPGTADDAARAVAAWPRTDLRLLLADTTTLAGLLGRPDRQSASRPRLATGDGRWTSLRALAETLRGTSGTDLLKRGALLHTDIAMLVPRALEIGSSTPPPGSVLIVSDGRSLGWDAGDLHWSLARLLLDGVMPDPTRDAMVRTWYRATAAHLIGDSDLAFAEPHLARARQLFPSDPVLDFLNGCLQEVFASARVQNVVQSMVLPPRTQFPIASSNTSLQRAATFFKAALDADPSLIEARIRLARVLALQGRSDAAVQELQRALAGGGGPLLEYYALLFLGGEQQRAGRSAPARESFERAAALFPRAQAPRLALSLLARTGGSVAQARQELTAMLRQPPADTGDDPWWTYLTAVGRLALPMLADIHQEFARKTTS